MDRQQRFPPMLFARPNCSLPLLKCRIRIGSSIGVRPVIENLHHHWSFIFKFLWRSQQHRAAVLFITNFPQLYMFCESLHPLSTSHIIWTCALTLQGLLLYPQLALYKLLHHCPCVTNFTNSIMRWTAPLELIPASTIIAMWLVSLESHLKILGELI